MGITINNIPTGYIATDTTGTLTATITPSDAFYNTVTWTSDNTSVLTIDETGKYTAVSAGSATVTAKTPEGNTATCTINVKVPVTDITINDVPTGYIAVDTTGTLTATISPNNATFNTVEWTSDNAGVLTIDETGKYTAVSAGSATVTATADGKSATCTINVKVPVTDTTINNVPAEYIVPDTTGTLTATVSPNNATFNTVTWTSNNTSVLTIDETGKYTAVSVGSANCNGKNSRRQYSHLYNQCQSTCNGHNHKQYSRRKYNLERCNRYTHSNSITEQCHIQNCYMVKQ